MKKILILLGLGLIGIAVFGLFFVPAAWLRFPLPDAPAIRVEIPEGASAKSVRDLLVEKKLLLSPTGYRLYGLFDSAVQHPQAGTYDLKFGLSYRQLARSLSLGPVREEISITIIEGWTIRDIEESLRQKGVDVQPSDFYVERFAAEFPFLKDLPPNATLEGYLFPDTYRLWKDQLPDGLLRKQLQEFSIKTAGYEDALKKNGRTLHEAVILASMIEKEVKRDDDRAIVAGIFMNRLREGMRLQSDATLNYVIRSGRSRLTIEETALDSAYNTYTNTGLPPSPISNPGKASLSAALNYAETNNFFFLTDSQGKTYFGRNLAEHIQNRQQAFGE